MNGFSRELLTYPLPPERWAELACFWQTEWPRTDVEWLEALRGVYADVLVIRLALARSGGEIVGTASVYYPKTHPEICCVADVLTHPKARGHGIAAALTDQAVQAAFAAGCRVAYLGNTVRVHSVYEKIGFRRIAGAIMRRAAPGAERIEEELYAAGQTLSVRPTGWADLPGMACLLAQPLGCVFADYPRGLVSAARAAPARCVSAFTTLWEAVARSAGAMLTLAGATPHRVLGFGTLTPGPGSARRHRAVIEAVAHDHFDSGLGLLLDALAAEARRRSLHGLDAGVAEDDSIKLRHFHQVGFRSRATLPNQILLDGKPRSVSLLALDLPPAPSPPP